jgi:hypothetical protein
MISTSAALDLPEPGPPTPLGLLDAQRHVADELGLEPVEHLARGELVAVLAGERRGVDADRDAERRLVDGDHRQRPRVVQVGERLADRHLGDAGDGDDLAGTGLVGLDALQCLGHVQLADLRLLDRPVGAAPGDVLAAADGAVPNAAECETPDVGRRIEVRDERLQRMARVVLGRRDRLDEQVHERRERVRERIRIQARLAGLGVRVHGRELDLRLVGVEVEEQLVGLVEHLGDARVRPVDLVDDEDDRQARLECLAQHEPRLRQRALRCVDEQQDAVDHRQPALDLAAEVGVARRVDDVQLHAAVVHRRVLGEDRDALLALEVVAVEHALVHVLVGAKRPALPEHGVDQRRLPMVDMGDDRDVADVLAGCHCDARG